MKCHITVIVTLKNGVLDPQGAAVERAFKSHGTNNIDNLRIGKLIQFDLEAPDKETAKHIATNMAEQLLANPVMEHFTVSVEA